MKSHEENTQKERITISNFRVKYGQSPSVNEPGKAMRLVGVGIGSFLGGIQAIGFLGFSVFSESVFDGFDWWIVWGGA